MNNTYDGLLHDIVYKLDRIADNVDFVKTRFSSYLGNREALTYLADETPIFVNTDDIGCPMNFISGGRYEEDYFAVFRSFRHRALPMMDVGANLGVYSLRMAQLMRGRKIHAFEPMPKVRELFKKSTFLNGFTDRITIHALAASDKSGHAFLSVPEHHVGGSSLSSCASEGINVALQPLDELFSTDFEVGLVKLDVEGHELHALKGMQRILQRSQSAVVMFEKLGSNTGDETFIEAEFSAAGMSVYRIAERNLQPVSGSGFIEGSGYFIGTQERSLGPFGLARNFFTIYPEDLNVLRGSMDGGSLRCNEMLEPNDIVFHGPYWHLPKGCYRIHLDATINGNFHLTICERFGTEVHKQALSQETRAIDVALSHDLQNFELVLRSAAPHKASLLFNQIHLEKIA